MDLKIVSVESRPDNVLPAAEPRDRATKSAYVWKLSRPWYILTLACIYGLYALCAAYFLAAGWLYEYLKTSFIAMSFEFYALALPRTAYRPVSIIHYAVGCVFTLMILAPLARRVMTKLSKKPKAERRSQMMRRSSSMAKIKTATTSALRRLDSGRRLSHATEVASTIASIFSVHSPHFEFVFSTREVLEIVLQTIQANQFSRSVPRPSLNRLYVLLLVINCWSGPIVHAVFPRDAAARRVLFIFSDIVLTIISIVGIPTFIFSDYIGIFDSEIMSVPLDFWAMDAPAARMCSEVSVVLLKTYFDIFMRCALALCTIFGLRSLQGMIRLRKTTALKSVATKPLDAVPNAKEPMALRTLNVLKLVHGVVVLALHIHASTKTHPPACLLSLEPWAMKQPACAVYCVNCAKLFADQQHDSTDIGTVLEEIDPNSVLSLVFHHCQKLVMPPNIKKYTGILGIKLYNNSFDKWDDHAAITNTDNPNMRYIYILRTYFPNETVPEGLRSPDFPLLLSDIEIVHSNLVTLPDILEERWASVYFMVFEFNAISVVPPVLLRLSLFPGLSLSHNNLTSVPAELLSSPIITSLWLKGNPLTELPADVDPSTSAVMVLDLTHTNLSKIPPWMDSAYLATHSVYADDTPLCDNMDTDTTGLVGRSSADGQSGGFIECGEVIGNEVFPIAFEDRQSAWPA